MKYIATNKLFAICFLFNFLFLQYAYSSTMEERHKIGRALYKTLKPINVPKNYVGIWMGKPLLGQSFFVISKTGLTSKCWVPAKVKKDTSFSQHKVYIVNGQYKLIAKGGYGWDMQMIGENLKLSKKSIIGLLEFKYDRIKVLPKICQR